MKTEPQIKEFMTLQPQSIEADESLKKARQMMFNLGIRHLPVTREGKVVGILSEREINLACGLEPVDMSQLLVSEVCSKNPYCVDPEASLREVAEVMAQKHYGSVIVMEEDKLAGIFTTVDACRTLAKIIESKVQTANLKEIFDIRHGPLSRFDL